MVSDKMQKHSVQELYNNDSNYKIVNISEKRVCFVFCSSNGLFDNHSEDYCAEHNYYEWSNISKNKKIKKCAGKIIFLRDVFCQSYVDGINKKIDSIDEILRFLKKETSGYKVVCCGSSAGGYLSMIIGSELENVFRVYSFGGIFSLYRWTGANDDYSFFDVKSYIKHIDDKTYNKWFSITNKVMCFNPLLFHFYGTKCKSDCVQIEELGSNKNQNIRKIGIVSSRHGGEFFGFVYPYLLTLNDKKMNKIFSNNTVFSKKLLSIKVMGFFSFHFSCFKRFLAKFSMN